MAKTSLPQPDEVGIGKVLSLPIGGEKKDESFLRFKEADRIIHHRVEWDKGSK
jgi:hypothetical protein